MRVSVSESKQVWLKSEAGHKVSLVLPDSKRAWDGRWDGRPFGERMPGDIFTVDTEWQAIVPFLCFVDKIWLFWVFEGS